MMLSVACGNQIDKLGLDPVGILIFVDQDVMKLFLIDRGDIVGRLEELERL